MDQGYKHFVATREALCVGSLQPSLYLPQRGHRCEERCNRDWFDSWGRHPTLHKPENAHRMKRAKLRGNSCAASADWQEFSW